MLNRSDARGFTLIEMIIAIVIISVGLAGVLVAFRTTVQSSADPLIHKQMLSIAEEMMEEIALKPYAVSAGTITGCNRSQADDISDYAGYSQPICDIDGNNIANLAGYTVNVTVVTGTLGTPAATGKKITVTVVHGADSLSLISWRTDYAS
jgi:MSHA pilin protein MshD